MLLPRTDQLGQLFVVQLLLLRRTMRNRFGWKIGSVDPTGNLQQMGGAARLLAQIRDHLTQGAHAGLGAGSFPRALPGLGAD